MIFVRFKDGPMPSTTGITVTTGEAIVTTGEVQGILVTTHEAQMHTTGMEMYSASSIDEQRKSIIIACTLIGAIAIIIVASIILLRKFRAKNSVEGELFKIFHTIGPKKNLEEAKVEETQSKEGTFQNLVVTKLIGKGTFFI